MADKPLHKTVIVVWSPKNPRKATLAALARDVEDGDSFLAIRETTTVADPKQDPQWGNATTYFDALEAMGSGDDISSLLSRAITQGLLKGDADDNG